MQITDICVRLQSDKPGDVARSLIAQQIGQRIASPTREGAGKGGLRGVWRCESHGKQGRKEGRGERVTNGTADSERSRITVSRNAQKQVGRLAEAPCSGRLLRLESQVEMTRVWKPGGEWHSNGF